jgi:16S rRNA (adenine1518-N6/adenine1519-N6)-dimethyltransferase
MSMTSAPVGGLSVRDLLDKYNLRPRKGLGQHFLADPNILGKIIEAADLGRDRVVLEIGPGLGTLTRQLVQSAGWVIAVEVDQAMVAVVREELGHVSNLEVVHGDILQLDPAALVRGRQSPHAQLAPDYMVVANLPYYITSAVIRHMLEADPPPRRMVLTVQREVAKRMVAGAGDMSLMAVSVQFYGRPRIVAKIPAGAFIPPPKVDSAVVRIDTYDAPPIDVPDVQHFFHIVRAGFGQKRKQLKNALSGGLGLPAGEVVAAMQKARIESRRRAQSLTLDEWARLAREFGSRVSKAS